MLAHAGPLPIPPRLRRRSRGGDRIDDKPDKSGYGSVASRVREEKAVALHRLTRITIGVPNVAPTAEYYEEFGLTPTANGRFATVDGGEQLELVPAPTRRLLELGIGVDDPDDLARVAAALATLGVSAERTASSVVAVDPGTEASVVVAIADRNRPAAGAAVPTNGPGRADRGSQRADAVLRGGAVRPRKLGHVVLGSTDFEASQRFFIEGLGF